MKSDDLDRPLRDAAWQAHELSIKLRSLIDALPQISEVIVPCDDLERLIALTSFIAGYRLAELDKAKEQR